MVFSKKGLTIDMTVALSICNNLVIRFHSESDPERSLFIDNCCDCITLLRVRVTFTLHLLLLYLCCHKNIGGY